MPFLLLNLSNRIVISKLLSTGSILQILKNTYRFSDLHRSSWFSRMSKTKQNTKINKPNNNNNSSKSKTQNTNITWNLNYLSRVLAKEFVTGTF